MLFWLISDFEFLLFRTFYNIRYVIISNSNSCLILIMKPITVKIIYVKKQKLCKELVDIIHKL